MNFSMPSQPKLLFLTISKSLSNSVLQITLQWKAASDAAPQAPTS